MGRNQTNPVSKLFYTYNIQKNESTCNIKQCRRPILKGRHSYNLETHIKCNHPEENKVLKSKKNENTLKDKRPLDDATIALPSLKVIKCIYLLDI